MSTVDIRYSKDGGHNWSDWRQVSMGQTGEFMHRTLIRRMGQGYQWIFDVRVTDNVSANLIGVSAQIEATP